MRPRGRTRAVVVAVVENSKDDFLGWAGWVGLGWADPVEPQTLVESTSRPVPVLD